jgi:hypothetical protein
MGDFRRVYGDRASLFRAILVYMVHPGIMYLMQGIVESAHARIRHLG